MTSESWMQVAWTAAMIATAGVLWRLWRERLIGVMPMLAAFLAVDAGASVALRFVPFRSNIYGHIFFGSRAIMWVLSVLVALELVTLITRHYPGIATLARWGIRLALFIALAAALGSLTIDLNRHGVEFPILAALTLVDRTVSVSVVCFILAAALFLLWFPIRLNRNVVSYALAFVVLYSVRVAVLLIIQANGVAMAPLASTLELVVDLVICVYWFATFRSAHEGGPVIVGHAWNRTKERNLIEQLESINATVLRATKQSKP